MTRHAPRCRMVGLLEMQARGPLLWDASGLSWLLEVDPLPDSLLGKTVLVDGTRIGLDGIAVDYIGAGPPPGGRRADRSRGERSP